MPEADLQSRRHGDALYPELIAVTGHSVNVIGTIWLSIATGTALMLAGVGVGWVTGRAASLPPVRLIAWWVRRVVLPLLAVRSWWRRAGMIFVNNASLLTVLVAVGRWPLTPLLGVACLGVSLGIAVRIMSSQACVFGSGTPAPYRRRARLGIALNLLEPPAIMLAIGLSLGRQAVPLSPTQVWETFAVWVIPALLLAAGGEALWLGAHGYPRLRRVKPCHPTDPTR